MRCRSLLPERRRVRPSKRSGGAGAAASPPQGGAEGARAVQPVRGIEGISSMFFNDKCTQTERQEIPFKWNKRYPLFYFLIFDGFF